MPALPGGLPPGYVPLHSQSNPVMASGIGSQRCELLRLASMLRGPCMYMYRVAHQDGKNLPLTELQQFQQLVGRYCSYLVPMQHGRMSQI